MILKKLAFLVFLFVPVIPALEEPVSSQSTIGFLEPIYQDQGAFEVYHKYFNRFRAYYAPQMTDEQANAAEKAYWLGSDQQLDVALYTTAMGVQESGLKVHKYNPKVHQSTDYMGAHYNVLFAELHKEGLFNGIAFVYNKKKQRSFLNLANPEVKKWYLYFKDNPDYGTMLAVRWYNNKFVKVYGLDRATRVWNQGDCLCLRYNKPGITEAQRQEMIIRRDKSLNYLSNIKAILNNVVPNYEVVLANYYTHS